MKLKDVRTGLGLGRLKASKMCGMQPPDLLRIETGKRTPGIKVVMRVCRALGLDPREINEFAPALAEAEAAGLAINEETHTTGVPDHADGGYPDTTRESTS